MWRSRSRSRSSANAASLDRVPLIDTVAAVSVGIVEHRLCLDLAYAEDSRAEVDMNVVMTGRGRFVEVQGTAEGTPFTAAQLAAMTGLAAEGIARLVAAAARRARGGSWRVIGLPSRLALATTNRGKVAEIAALLASYDVEVIPADRLVAGWSVVEDGTTFEENARIKARDLAGRADLPALGDDSGLEVAALGGRPGVHSARYAGPGASDGARMLKLLEELRDVGDGRRAARFRCALALAWPDGRLIEAEGRCDGMIARAPRGSGGFGYDPVFIDAASGMHLRRAASGREERAQPSPACPRRAVCCGCRERGRG